MKLTHRIIQTVLLGASFLFANSSFAQKIVTIENATGNAQIFQMLEDRINNEFPDVDVDDYLTGTANSFAFSASGLGVDYSDNMSLFMVGLQLGIAADTTLGFSDLFDEPESKDTRGVGANASLSFGLNLKLLPFNIGPINTDKMKVFVNLGSIDNSDLVEKTKVKASTFGMHLQYKLLDDISVAGPLARWEGVNVTLGFQATKFDISVTETVEETVTESGVSASFSGPVTFRAKGSTFNVPLEVSTGARVAYVLSVYGGLGLDLRVGEADGSGTGGGQVTAENPITAETESADAILNISKSSDADAGGARIFGGAQLNLSLLKVFIQAQKSLGDDLIAASAGVRVSW